MTNFSESYYVDLMSKEPDLGLVPEAFQSNAVLLAAISAKPSEFFAIPNDRKTYELCKLAVEGKGLALLAVPKKFRDHSLCLAAVKNNVSALHDVPAGTFSEDEICDLVKIRANVLKMVKTDDVTERICFVAVTSDGYALNFVPDQLKTDAVLAAALKTGVIDKEYGSIIIDSVPKEKWTVDLVMASGFSFSSRPSFIKADISAILLNCVKVDYRELSYVDKRYWTPDVILAAYEQNPDAVNLISDDDYRNHVVPYINKRLADVMVNIVERAFNPSSTTPFDVEMSCPRI